MILGSLTARSVPLLGRIWPEKSIVKWRMMPSDTLKTMEVVECKPECHTLKVKDSSGQEFRIFKCLVEEVTTKPSVP